MHFIAQEIPDFLISMHVSIGKSSGRHLDYSQSMQNAHGKQQALTCSRYVRKEVQNKCLDSFKILEIIDAF